MTNVAIIIILIISSLPFSAATKDSLTNRIVNSRIGEELRVENDSQNISNGDNVSLPDFVLSPLPYKKANFNDFAPWGRAAKAIDLATDETLYEKNGDQKLQIASLTKLMTAIVTVENSKPDDVVTVPQFPSRPDEEMMGLNPGEKIKVDELVHAVLIYSAGDAAEVLAIHIPGSKEKFVAMMNKRASEMGLTNTHFANPVGLDDQGNYSTANDLINLTRIFLRDKSLKDIVSEQSYVAKNEAGNIYNLKTTNKLLDDTKIFGIKTGYTLGAGECLITLAKENDHEILTIVLGSQGRFAETNNLVNWAYQNWEW